MGATCGGCSPEAILIVATCGGTDSATSWQFPAFVRQRAGRVARSASSGHPGGGEIAMVARLGPPTAWKIAMAATGRPRGCALRTMESSSGSAGTGPIAVGSCPAPAQPAPIEIPSWPRPRKACATTIGSPRRCPRRPQIGIEPPPGSPPATVHPRWGRNAPPHLGRQTRMGGRTLWPVPRQSGGSRIRGRLGCGWPLWASTRSGQERTLAVSRMPRGSPSIRQVPPLRTSHACRSRDA